MQRVLQRAIMQMQSSGKSQVEVGDVLAATFDEEDSHAVYYLKSHGISRLDVLEYISHGGGKEAAPEGAGSGEERDGKAAGSPLEQYTVDLVAKARKGEIDPLIGRDPELTRTIHVLLRRRKNNPIFVGDPGVGKTALAEGLALRIVGGDVPEGFQDAHLRPGHGRSWPAPSTGATSSSASKAFWCNSKRVISMHSCSSC